MLILSIKLPNMGSGLLAILSNSTLASGKYLSVSTYTLPYWGRKEFIDTLGTRVVRRSLSKLSIEVSAMECLPYPYASITPVAPDIVRQIDSSINIIYPFITTPYHYMLMQMQFAKLLVFIIMHIKLR